MKSYNKNIVKDYKILIVKLLVTQSSPTLQCPGLPPALQVDSLPSEPPRKSNKGCFMYVLKTDLSMIKKKIYIYI